MNRHKPCSMKQSYIQNYVPNNYRFNYQYFRSSLIRDR